MKTLFAVTLVASALLTPKPASAICGKDHKHRTPTSTAVPTNMLPPDAVPGECYARVARPAEYREVVDQVVKHEAHDDIRITPARYETRMEQVLVKPASTRIVQVPAEHEMVSREVEVEPARQEWRRGKCNPRAIVDNATGECWCLVDVPARYKTVQERVVSRPATTRAIDVPAEYEEVAKRVLVEAEREERIPVPAVYENVTRKELVSEASVEWVRIECEASKSSEPASGGWYSFPRLGNRVH
jgi:hypothetical protein